MLNLNYKIIYWTISDCAVPGARSWRQRHVSGHSHIRRDRHQRQHTSQGNIQHSNVWCLFVLDKNPLKLLNIQHISVLRLYVFTFLKSI